MKASLVSATSLGALLAFEVFPAHAQVFTLNSNPGFGNWLVNCQAFTGCTTSLSETATLTVTSTSPSTLVFGAATTPFKGNATTSIAPTLTASGKTYTNLYTFAPTVKGQTATQSIAVTATYVSNTTKSKVIQSSLFTMTGTGVAPVESVAITNAAGASGTANSGNLGYVEVNASTASATVTVNNTGNGNQATNAPTSISNLTGSVTLGAGTGYSGSVSNPGNSVSLHDTSSQAYTYIYNPTARGSATSVVTLNFSDGSGTNGTASGQNLTQSVTYTLTGTGVAPVESTTSGGLVNPAASSSNPYVLVGTALGNTQTAAATVTIHNNGDGNLAGTQAAYNLNGSVSISGSGFSGSTSVSLASSGGATTSSTSYTYVFKPTVTGAAGGTATVAYSNGSTNNQNQSQTQTFNYTGTGVAPIATLTGSGNYALVGNTKSVLVTVQNTGNGNLSGAGTISNLQGTVLGATSGTNSALFTGTNTSLTNASNTTGLLDSGTQSVSYVFQPTTVGSFTANVTGNFSNGIGNTNTAGSETTTITGTGVAPIATVALNNAGYVLVNSGANTATVTVTVTNTGNGNLAGADSPTLQTNLHGTQGAASSSVFTGSGGSINLTGTGVGATQATNFTYNFAPTQSGAASTVVTSSFTNGTGFVNGTGAALNQSGTVTSTLTGTGVAPIQTVTATTIGHNGYVLVQQTAAATVTIQNVGNGNLAGSTTAFNLNGSISNTISGFTGGVTTPTSSVSLNDSHYAGSGATLTQTYSYTFAPVVKGATASTTLTAAFSNGSNNGSGQGYNQSQTVTQSYAATGVAPIASVSASNVLSRTNNYGYATNSGTGTAAVTIQNTGNGNLSGLGTISNLNAGSISVSNAGSYLTAAGGNSTSLSLGDTTTSTLSYVYKPVSRGANTATVSIAFSDGDSSGNNLSQTVQSTISGQGVGPVYQSKVGATVNTPIINGGTASASSINFGTVNKYATETIDLNVSNITTDGVNFGAGASLTDLTLVAVSKVTGGTDPSAFTIGSYGSLIVEGGSTYLPITLHANESGTLTGDFTITTDENAPLGDAGDQFTYALTANSVVPEPASLLVLGVGVAGLGAARRRRRNQDANKG